jgi:zinc protease
LVKENKIHQPKIVKHRSGLTALFEENHDSPVVSILFFVKVGAADETLAQGGLAHLHEHMIFKGTPTRPVGKVASEIEGAGGDINAYTTFDHTCYFVNIASRYWRVGMDVLSDAIQNASFDAQELAGETKVVLEEMARSEDIPSQRVSKHLFAMAFNKHPYGRPILGEKEGLLKMRRKNIMEFFQRYYQPSNMILVVAGDFDAGEAEKRLDDLFDKRKPGSIRRPARTLDNPPRRPRVKIEFGDVTETTLEMAWRAPSLMDPDTASGDALSFILGEGETSRINQRIRRQKKLVYGAGSGNITLSDAGLVTVGAVCDPKKTLGAIKALIGEVERLRRRPATASELARARANIAGSFVFERETPSGIARKLGYSYLHFKKLDYDEVYLRRLAELCPEDLRRFAEKHLSPKSVTLSLMLPKAFKKSLNLSDIKKALQIDDAEFPAPKAGVKKSPKVAALTVHAVRGAKRRLKMITLQSGVRLIVKEAVQAPIVSIKACMHGGKRFESASKAGISRLAASLFTKGTKNYSAREFAEAVESLPGQISGFSGRNSIGFSAEFLSTQFDEGMDLMAEAMLTPTFPVKEFELRRHEQLAALARMEDHLAGRCLELFMETLFQKHPCGISLLGTPKSLQAIEAKDIATFYKRVLQPKDLVIAVVGDVSVEQAVAMAEKHFGSLKARAKPLPSPASEPAPDSPRQAMLKRNKEQAHLVVGFAGTTITGKDRHALEILNAILSGQGGRLFMELRERRRLAYAVSSIHYEGPEVGAYGAYIGATHAKVDEARAAILHEFEKVREKTVSKKELEDAKRYLIGSAEIDLAHLSYTAQAMALDELFGLSFKEPFRIAKRICDITPRRLRDVARRYLDPDTRVEALITR